MKIYNLLGQEVKMLVDGVEAAGYKSVEWNSRQTRSTESCPTMSFRRAFGRAAGGLAVNNHGNSVASGVSSKGGYASGVYFYRHEAVSVAYQNKIFTQVRKMVLIR